KKLVQQKTKGTVFYDSVLFGLLLISYPFYWLILNIITSIFIDNFYIRISFLVMPILAWICMVWKDALTLTIKGIITKN
ncbi:MAG: hypothetical protein H7068_11940, partial [Pedobacter sp.]|nr:hypothetical protein [Chitinophagaceae bacterium]